ncbi:ATP-dependent DNA helicase RecG [Nocardioides sp. Root79]|uniref:ATP-dependent DNA helicase RecG n=1 Tax=Nocardioides sp. Root79 TaxID=1736600 RepID=UPI000702E5FD|nr:MULTISPECIES: ATP-dependent DNA helicase RecG [unclassified Nocardioides]KRC46184.1 ATP-dependent DNA helicase RecG [Nocardioides sp. Root79]KRC69532.1 ATP-dependent DNA helicase RecG [Nocardioides sp. Root240]
MAITFESPLTAVLGAAKPAQRKKFEDGLGLRTVGDLLHHFPRRYLETGSLTRVSDLRIGQLLCVVGEIAHSETIGYTDRRSGRYAYRVEAILRTAGPSLKMTFFAKGQRMADWHANRVAVGNRGVFLGKAGRFRDQWQLTNPQLSIFGMADGDEDSAVQEVLEFGALYPIYPLTKGLQTWDVARAVKVARDLVDDVPEILPAPVRDHYDVAGIADAYAWVHRPEDREQVERAHHRFRFEEALVTQLVLGRRRRAIRSQGATVRDGGDGAVLGAFDERLPFELTAGQAAVGKEIDHDLAQPHPMNRLLQGEVGSGKTLVALRAMLRVVDSGGQTALLAPTEVLAQQHYRSIVAMLGELADGGTIFGSGTGTRVELLTGSMTKTQRTGPLSRIASGEAGIVIGTHALLQDNVFFADLGLVVVDEQHRFGVEQRAALTDKAAAPPHLLVMTATPIPRTVAMTVFGDLETSTLTELPAGRAPIQTNVVPLAEQPAWLGRVWERVREEVAKGHQVYVVCPRISGDETEAGQVEVVDLPDEDTGEEQRPKPPAAAVEEVVERLSSGALEGLRIGLLHGRLPADEKDATMRAFAAGDIDVLVSTTVIEVGVDVANATGMVILDADRFGVSQLHQLRGRVGRGGLPGLCLLVTHAEAESPARERIEAVAATTDGFALSRVDLEMRREGDVLGASQAGRRSSLVNLRVLRDEDTILAAREAAEALLDVDTDLSQAPGLADAVRDLELSQQADFVDKS